jgi:hypothetical protein
MSVRENAIRNLTVLSGVNISSSGEVNHIQVFLLKNRLRVMALLRKIQIL